MCADQFFTILTRFIENTCNIKSLNKFVIKIYSTIYLMILIMYYKY